MSRVGILLTVLVLALIGIALYSLDPARPSLGGKKRRPEARQSSSSPPRSGGRQSSTSGATDGGETGGNAQSGGQNQTDQDKTPAVPEKPRYDLPYGSNLGYTVHEPDPESSAVLFDVPAGTPVSSIRSGVVVGVSGPTPKPGEDLVFGRQLPRNAILIQHEDSSFALYQNVQAHEVAPGAVVPSRTEVARMRSSGSLKVSVSHLTREDFQWHFSTKRYPDGGYLRSGEAYLRSDSDLDHPVNSVSGTWTADAGNYRKTVFRPGETVRLHSRFAFPIRATVRYGIRAADTSHLTYEDARLDPGRKAAHADFRPDDSPGTRVAYLYFDDQPMDSLHFSVVAPD